MTIRVGPECLIPRPETEGLVERAIDFLRKRAGQQQVLDLCTGSGCIAVAIAKNHPAAKVVATDICEKRSRWRQRMCGRTDWRHGCGCCAGICLSR